MDTKLLEVFLAVVHAGSISGAARRLDFSQPAVSQQIKALEKVMETDLFSREGGRIRLTPAGEALQGYAEQTLTSWRFVREQVRRVADGEVLTQITLGSFPSANGVLLAEAAADLLSTDPSLRIKLIDTEPPANFDLLRSGQCDALITFGYPDDEVARGFVELPLLHEKYVLLVQDGAELSNRTTAPLEAARDESWIGGCPKCSHELALACRDRGFVPRVLCSTDDSAMTHSLVAHGVGVAMRPVLTTIGQRRAGVHSIEIDQGLSRIVSLVVPADRAEDPAIRSLYQALRRSTQHLVELDQRGLITALPEPAELAPAVG